MDNEYREKLAAQQACDQACDQVGKASIQECGQTGMPIPAPNSAKRCRIEDLERQRDYHIQRAAECSKSINTLLKYPRDVVDDIMGAV